MKTTKKKAKSVDDLTSTFLTTLIKNKSVVSVYLRTGVKLIGQITCFDNETLTLKNHHSQLVYMHAINTIVPN